MCGTRKKASTCATDVILWQGSAVPNCAVGEGERSTSSTLKPYSRPFVRRHTWPGSKEIENR